MSTPVALVELAGGDYIPISPEGNEIRNHVCQSRQMRTPVGYNQSFLEAYYPNETSICMLWRSPPGVCGVAKENQVAGRSKDIQ
jgi:hypothetical protein